METLRTHSRSIRAAAAALIMLVTGCSSETLSNKALFITPEGAAAAQRLTQLMPAD